MTAEKARNTGRALANNPSVSALIFQASAVIEHLGKFTINRYPQETVRIARYFQVIACRTRDCFKRYDPLAEEMRDRQKVGLLRLARIIQKLNSLIRYLETSDPYASHPCVQEAITGLVDIFALPHLDANLVVLTRPQWEYNLKFVNLAKTIDTFCNWSDLDPNFEHQVSDLHSLLEKIWNNYNDIIDNAENGNEPAPPPPKFVAVLSFAELDRDDALLYPLLSHELGHFLDLSRDTPAFEDKIVNKAISRPSNEQMQLIRVRTGDGRPLIEARKQLYKSIDICLSEVIADLLAARMMGVAYFIALAEYFKTRHAAEGALVDLKSGYPRFNARLWLVWDEIMSAEGGMSTKANLDALFASNTMPGHSGIIVQEYLKTWEEKLKEPENRKPISEEVNDALEQILADCFLKSLEPLRQIARSLIPEDRAASIPADISDMVTLLNHRCPPFQHASRKGRKESNYKSRNSIEILTAGWFYQIGCGEIKEASLSTFEKQRAEYSSTCALLLKAIELARAEEAIKAIDSKNKRTPEKEKDDSILQPLASGVASGPMLRDALNAEDIQSRLIVCPDFGDDPIESASWDMHLGNWFRIAQRTQIDSIDIAYRDEQLKIRKQAQTEHYIPFGSTFVLQPGDFALTTSLEYISFPNDLMAFVEGKSSLGRAGLLIATATQVAPGFRGCIVLELFNAGTVPILLRPGMRIAQLVFLHIDARLTDKWLYGGNYKAQVRP